ncbi:MAG: hydroxylamine reductase [Planctomycetaceae bacterium]|nr:hydroxylamine reductase [Planctomycetaceae bacterium]
MFCYQCEQAAAGSGCSKRGVCGKSAEVSDLHDLLVEVAAGVSAYARALPGDEMEAGRFVVQALFTTVTNVNFTDESVAEWVKKGIALRDRLAEAYGRLPDASRSDPLPPCATFVPPEDIPGMTEVAIPFGIIARQKRLGEDKAGVLYMVIYGLKGAAAYIDHAYRLGVEEPSLYRMFHETLALTCSEPDDMNVLLQAALKAGEINLKAMELLDTANTSRYGHPEPTSVRVTPVAGKCILVSGHDLLDLYDLLVATEGKGINVYTHSEMLPCNAYPVMKNFSHLVGNYGGAWQEQQREFADFPGPILLTTNCLMPPQPSYKDRVYTTGLVSFPGVKHLENGQFQPLIDAALALPGFTEDAPEHRITIGFARNAILSVADQVVEAVKGGLIRHFFLIGGCDGAKPGRNYYTEFAEKTPMDTVILTLACGKYRFNKLDFGDIGGIPRLLDVGQCNDAYSAVQVAVALAKAFDCGVNDLPLSFILSWYEQKAVAILLTLLHLGVKNIRLGPTLPAFATPAVLEVLGSTFGLSPITTPDEDLALALGALS